MPGKGTQDVPSGFFRLGLPKDPRRIIFDFVNYNVFPIQGVLAMTIRRRTLYTLIFLLAAALTTSCAVVSKDVKKIARKDIAIERLLQNPEKYIGQTVLLGGYVLETRNQPKKTEIVVLQTPLSFWDEPGPRDESRGRFVGVSEMFLDPEIFAKNRKVTLAGRVIGTRVDSVGTHPYPYLLLETLEVYLWPKFSGYRRYPYPYADPFYPHPFYRDPFYRDYYGW